MARRSFHSNKCIGLNNLTCTLADMKDSGKLCLRSMLCNCYKAARYCNRCRIRGRMYSHSVTGQKQNLMGRLGLFGTLIFQDSEWNQVGSKSKKLKFGWNQCSRSTSSQIDLVFSNPWSSNLIICRECSMLYRLCIWHLLWKDRIQSSRKDKLFIKKRRKKFNH